MTARRLAVAIVVLAGCAGMTAYNRAMERAAHQREACLGGLATACRDAADHPGPAPRPIGERAQLLRRGCELGVAADCADLTLGWDDPAYVATYLRACRLGEPRGCARVVNRADAGPRVRAEAEARICALSPRACADLGEGLLRDTPALAARLAARACELDATLCDRANEIVARSRWPDACHRARGSWDDCLWSAPSLDLLRRACADGSEPGCAKLGERLVRDQARGR